jgi:DNA-binding ferritin-like protein
MYASPNSLPSDARSRIADTLNARLAESLRDVDTVDLLTGAITGFEKHAWFLRASLES